MKGLRDTLAIAVIAEWATKLSQDPPEFRPDTFESLMNSYLAIGDLLITLQHGNERKDEHETERGVSG